MLPVYRYGRVISFCLVLVISIGCGGERSTDKSPARLALAQEGEPAVELVIDYGDGSEKRLKQIPFSQQMTVRGALDFAAAHPHGVTFKSTGTAESAMLTSIDDLSNEGGGDGRNWMYRVNGKLATKSFDAYTLTPGDVILWKFEKYE
jgi:hypothetical protein